MKEFENIEREDDDYNTVLKHVTYKDTDCFVVCFSLMDANTL